MEIVLNVLFWTGSL